MNAESLTLQSDTLAVTLSYADGVPEIASIGPPTNGYNPAVDERPVPHAWLDTAVPLAIVSEISRGHQGAPGIIGARPDRSAWSPRFTLDRVERDDTSATFVCIDAVAELSLAVSVSVDRSIEISACLTNDGTTAFGLQRLGITIPVAPHHTDAVTFDGRWCREFSTTRSTIGATIQIENREGRSGHSYPPGVFVGTPAFSAERGDVIGAQLAWSGNHTIVVDRRPDGRAYIQLSELLEPGEVEIAPGASYTTPSVVAVWSPSGLNGASQGFHHHVRARLGQLRPRPALLNTWEAVYFDHDLATLKRLADAAAEVGVERFVLDDGWFGSRRDDTAGLGDWWVSDEAWPHGLNPIIDHVRSLGMEFGLWVEPEMVNPDSDLYRAHPEWALVTDGYDAPLARHQLVLDLGRPEVVDYLFDRLDALLNDYEIAYLKWDMNRPMVQGSHRGHAGVHGHVVGLYDLLDRLRTAHPDVEIESCASGGGRPDLGIVGRAQRIWTSDCNDALERQHIQAGATLLLPPEVLGAHIGPDVAHTTGRHQPLAFRAATAMFGHFGIEWNLLAATDDERAVVAAAVATYQRLRGLLHAGDVYTVDHPDPTARVHGVVSEDRTRAIFAYAQLVPSATTTPIPMRVIGLDPNLDYRVRAITDLGVPPTLGRRQPDWQYRDGAVVGGAQLANTGIQPPILLPESVMLIEVEAVDPAHAHE